MMIWLYAAALVAAALLTLAGFLAFWQPGPPINDRRPPPTAEPWMWQQPPARRPRHRWENLEQHTRRLRPPPKDPPDIY